MKECQTCIPWLQPIFMAFNFWELSRPPKQFPLVINTKTFLFLVKSSIMTGKLWNPISACAAIGIIFIFATLWNLQSHDISYQQDLEVQEQLDSEPKINVTEVEPPVPVETRLSFLDIATKHGTDKVNPHHYNYSRYSSLGLIYLLTTSRSVRKISWSYQRPASEDARDWAGMQHGIWPRKVLLHMAGVPPSCWSGQSGHSIVASYADTVKVLHRIRSRLCREMVSRHDEHQSFHRRSIRYRLPRKVHLSLRRRFWRDHRWRRTLHEPTDHVLQQIVSDRQTWWYLLHRRPVDELSGSIWW